MATRDQDNYLLHQVTLSPVKATQTGKLVFIFDAKVCKTYGPNTLYAYVVVNGQKQLTDDYKITLRADVVEDFSALTPAQRQQAPIMDMDTQFDLGTVAAGKHLKTNISLKNSGTNALAIHRVYSSDENVVCTAPKAVKASPKAATIKVDINTMENGKPMEPGKYARQILVITNDPNHPRHTVNLTWTVK